MRSLIDPNGHKIVLCLFWWTSLVFTLPVRALRIFWIHIIHIIIHIA